MKTILFLITIALLPVTAFSADTLKFKHAVSVYADAAENKIIQPEGVGCNDQSLFIVADTGNGRLIPYSFQGGILKPGSEIKVSELVYPLTVKMNSRGEIFVLDGKKRRILRFGPEGSFKGYLDPAGAPPPATVVPRNFAFDRNDAVYILDIFSDRVLVLDREGKFQKQIDTPKGGGIFSDIAVDSKGAIFLIESSPAMLWSAGKDAGQFTLVAGGLKDYLDFPVGIAIDGRGMMFLIDRHGGGVVILGPDGSFHGRQLHMGWAEGLVNFPSQICVNEKGEMYIADRSNNRVQIFTVVK